MNRGDSREPKGKSLGKGIHIKAKKRVDKCTCARVRKKNSRGKNIISIICRPCGTPGGINIYYIFHVLLDNGGLNVVF